MDALTPVQIFGIVICALMVLIITLHVTCKQYFKDVGYYTIPTLGNIYNNLQNLTVPSGFNTTKKPKVENQTIEEPNTEEPILKDSEQILEDMYKIKNSNLTFPTLKLISNDKSDNMNNHSKLNTILDNLSNGNVIN